VISFRSDLELFCAIDYQFPNLIVGAVTRSSTQKAFALGIKASQIIAFLEAHAHITARAGKLALEAEA